MSSATMPSEMVSPNVTADPRKSSPREALLPMSQNGQVESDFSDAFAAFVGGHKSDANVLNSDITYKERQTIRAEPDSKEETLEDPDNTLVSVPRPDDVFRALSPHQQANLVANQPVRVTTPASTTINHTALSGVEGRGSNHTRDSIGDNQLVSNRIGETTASLTAKEIHPPQKPGPTAPHQLPQNGPVNSTTSAISPLDFMLTSGNSKIPNLIPLGAQIPVQNYTSATLQNDKTTPDFSKPKNVKLQTIVASVDEKPMKITGEGTARKHGFQSISMAPPVDRTHSRPMVENGGIVVDTSTHQTIPRIVHNVENPLFVTAQIDVSDVPLTSSRATVTQGGQTASPYETARAIASQMAAHIQKANNGNIELTLAPEELGRVRIGISQTEVGMIVAVSAERPETIELMRRHAAVLEREFYDIEQGNVSFSFEQNGSRDQSETSQEKAARPTTVFVESADVSETLSRHYVTSSPGLDLRL